MDYHVSCSAAFGSVTDRQETIREAITQALSSTACLITGAALIIVAVFAGFARGDLVMFQQMGFGVAVALLIDALIVRTVLVPASMTRLGKWNWYLPRWLEWLPRLEVDGAHDAAVTPKAAKPSSPPS